MGPRDQFDGTTEAETTPVPDEHPEADALDQRAPAESPSPPWAEGVTQSEASDLDLADQATPANAEDAPADVDPEDSVGYQ